MDWKTLWFPLNLVLYVFPSEVKTFNPAADSTLGKRKIKEEVKDEDDDQKPPKAKKVKKEVESEDEADESISKKKKKKKKRESEVEVKEEPADEEMGPAGGFHF